MIFNILKIKKQLEDFDGTIVAATKYFTAKEMREVYKQGLSHFGENRVQDFLSKKSELTDLDITWHFIGTLQRKKVKKCINEIDYLHSLDHLSLAEEINKRRNTPLKCFLQVNISDEESKHGLTINQVSSFIDEIKSFKNIQLIGLMGMATHTDDQSLIEQQFEKLTELQKDLKDNHAINLTELSIGMSNDYLLAIKHNATFLRLGSVLFKKEV